MILNFLTERKTANFTFFNVRVREVLKLLDFLMHSDSSFGRTGAPCMLDIYPDPFASSHPVKSSVYNLLSHNKGKKGPKLSIYHIINIKWELTF